jgi:short-subunit dehydrogenase
MSTLPIALITGASSGIGRAFAERLAKGGHDLVLVARRKERLDALASALRKDHGSTCEVLVADLASEAGLAAVERRAGLGDVALLVNNAGVSRYRPFATLPPEAIDELVRLHVLGTTRLARAALPSMIERKHGAIINVASLLSVSGTLPLVPLPPRAVYASAKAYLLAFSQLLAGEVGPNGVRVQALLPGVVATEFHDDMPEAKSKLPPAMTAEDVVTASLSALAAGEVVCIPPLEDAAFFDRIGEAQRGVFGSVRSSALAGRYRR